MFDRIQLTNMPDCQYSPLIGPNSIRLLYLRPSSLTDHLHGDLREVSLEEKPDYGALSYTWGEPIFDQEIKSGGGHTIAITRNLMNALCRLHKPAKTLIIWIDAICICWGYWNISYYWIPEWISRIRLPHIRHHHENLLQSFHGQLSFTIREQVFFPLI
jgi:hypothetical protein